MSTGRAEEANILEAVVVVFTNCKDVVPERGFVLVTPRVRPELPEPKVGVPVGIPEVNPPVVPNVHPADSPFSKLLNWI